jgi:uncharacterized protein YbjT (DUF2867 family)
MTKPILVTGATGKQGGAVVNALLESPNAKDFTILAVTRNPESASAKRLVERGVQIVQGDLNDVEDIFSAAKAVNKEPIWGVFSVQTPMAKSTNVQTEEAQGKALVDAALAHDVKFFVYSSIDRGGEKSFDNPTPIPHFISKHNIEHHLVDKAGAKGEKLGWTILRPTAFLDVSLHMSTVLCCRIQGPDPKLIFQKTEFHKRLHGQRLCHHVQNLPQTRC